MNRIIVSGLILTSATAALTGCSGAALETEKPGQAGDLPRYSCADGNRCNFEYCDQISVPGGEFLMGSSDQEEITESSEGLFYEGVHTPAHPVYLKPFCIDKYEVTLERYRECVRAGVCDPKGHIFADGDTGEEIPEGGVYVNHYPETCGENLFERIEKCPHRAVNCKSYEQAKTYCEWIGRRLCTEAEWERVANGPGPEKLTYPWGNEELSLQYANVSLTSDETFVEPVDSHAEGKSVEGVFNLVGNVFEWVSDYYAPYEENERTVINPIGPDTGTERVCRGGCAFSSAARSNVERIAANPTFDWG